MAQNLILSFERVIIEHKTVKNGRIKAENCKKARQLEFAPFWIELSKYSK